MEKEKNMIIKKFNNYRRLFKWKKKGNGKVYDMKGKLIFEGEL